MDAWKKPISVEIRSREDVEDTMIKPIVELPVMSPWSILRTSKRERFVVKPMRKQPIVFTRRVLR